MAIRKSDPRWPNEQPAGLLFSSCGSLFHPASGATRLDAVRWSEPMDIVGTDHGFIHVPSELLDAEYMGGRCPYRCATWGERFFTGLYSHRCASCRQR